MGRAEKRREQREFNKAAEEIKRLSPAAIRIIEKYAKLEAEEKLELYKKMVDNAVFNAMRENKIGQDRAYKIMERASELIIQGISKEVE